MPNSLPLNGPGAADATGREYYQERDDEGWKWSKYRGDL